MSKAATTFWGLFACVVATGPAPVSGGTAAAVEYGPLDQQISELLADVQDTDARAARVAEHHLDLEAVEQPRVGLEAEAAPVEPARVPDALAAIIARSSMSALP